jgi:cell division cycle 20-like protein 1 (cofactor of APC complex)
VQIWDAAEGRIIRTMSGHTARVGALAWNDAILSSGSHDKLIYHRDVRVPEHYIATIASHKEEVCGLRWNSHNQLASGGNDNKLFVFDKMNETPLYKFTEHCAAIKAIAWSPHQHGVLASGGGTADMKLRFWNTLTGTLNSEIDTGSQICNLMWSKNSNEVVSTHGFSAGQAQNQGKLTFLIRSFQKACANGNWVCVAVCIWKYPTLNQVATLTGHTYRVLYLAMSPDVSSVLLLRLAPFHLLTARFPPCRARRSSPARATRRSGSGTRFPRPRPKRRATRPPSTTQSPSAKP